METKFNFNSQICTTREQSERLMALGLKKETADMCLTPFRIKVDGDPLDYTEHCSLPHGKDIPAWSLHRLIEMMPENIFTGVRNQWHRVMYNGALTYEEGDETLVSFRGANIYDRCINCIEWLIKEGYFPKEYLNN